MPLTRSLMSPQAVSLLPSSLNAGFSPLHMNMPSKKKKGSLEALVETVQDCFDGHTAALFVSDLDEPDSSASLYAVSSFSTKIIPDAVIKKGQGLLGWSFREGGFLHATDFSRDTRTLGIYAEDVGIKALMVAALEGGCGILMVDSRSQFAFPQKKQGQFRAIARMGGELVRAFIHEERLGFWDRFNYLYPRLFLGPQEALDAVLGITGLDTGYVLSFKEKKVLIDCAVPADITGMNSAIYRDVRFLGSILLKHKTPIVSQRFKGAGKRDDLREGLGPSIIALPVLNGESVGYALVVSGSSNLIGWPKGLEVILAGILKGAFDRHGI